MDLTGWLTLGSLALQGLSAYKSSSTLSSAYGDAASVANAATKYGIDINMDMFNKSWDLIYEPLYKEGINALQRYKDLPVPELPSATVDFTFDPNDQMYKIQQEEGEKAINRALAARGLHDSRPGINALADFNRKLIAEETQKQYDRALAEREREYKTVVDQYGLEAGKYSGLANLGVQGANTLTNLAAQTGRNVGDMHSSMGKTSAEGVLGQGQQKAGLWDTAGTVLPNALAQYDTLSKIFGGKGVSGLSNLFGGGGTPAATGTGTNALVGGGTAAAAGAGATIPGALTASQVALQTGAPATVSADLAAKALATKTVTSATPAAAGLTGAAAGTLGAVGAAAMLSKFAPVVHPIMRGIASGLGMDDSEGPGWTNYLDAIQQGLDYIPGWGKSMQDFWSLNPDQQKFFVENALKGAGYFYDPMKAQQNDPYGSNIPAYTQPGAGPYQDLVKKYGISL